MFVGHARILGSLTLRLHSIHISDVELHFLGTVIEDLSEIEAKVLIFFSHQTRITSCEDFQTSSNRAANMRKIGLSNLGTEHEIENRFRNKLLKTLLESESEIGH